MKNPPFGGRGAGLKRNVEDPAINTDGLYVFERGNKVFELSNHLGNVLVTVSDRKLQIQSSTDPELVEGYMADVMTANDYYPGGMEMSGRKYNNGTKYRYGFQNQEVDTELWGGAIAYAYRVEDPRLNRFFSVDPLDDDYPWNSPYAFAENRLIDGVELEGLEWKPYYDKNNTQSRTPIGYNWAGYEEDGTPVKGTVSSATVRDNFHRTFEYSSNQKALSGRMEIYTSHKKPVITSGWGGYDYSDQFNYTFYFNTLKNRGTSMSGGLNRNVTQITVDVWNIEETTNFISGNTKYRINYILNKNNLYEGLAKGVLGVKGEVSTSKLEPYVVARLGLEYTPSTSINSDGLGPFDYILGGGFKFKSTLKTLGSKSPVKFFTNFSKNNKGFTVFQWKNGKDFRVDLDLKNGLHYHRRRLDPFGITKPGQGIGRHRPWQSKSTDQSFLDRF